MAKAKKDSKAVKVATKKPIKKAGAKRPTSIVDVIILKKGGSKKKVLKGLQKVLGKNQVKYLDTWNPDKAITTRKTGVYADTWSPEKPNRGKTGMYLDTWLPEGVDSKSAQLYADTWVPTAKISKGVKTGLYADVWVPAYASLKMKKKK